MPRTSIHNGLKQSSRLAALCGQQPPSPATRPPWTRRYNAGQSQAASEGRARKAKEEDEHVIDLTFSTDVEFQGFPHLEPNRSKQEKQHEDHRRVQNEEAQSHARPLQDTRTNAQSNPYSTTGGFTHQQLMRRMQKPRRFRPLLREVRLSGEDNPRGHKDLGTGKQKRVLSRCALSTEVLEAELRWISRNAPAPRAVRNILKILIEERGIKPTLSHYEALILGQCHPEFGSIENVKIILQELEQEGIPLEVPVLLAALTVLSVHPDTSLRCNILDRLTKQQFALPDSYAHLNILALVREEQLEMATVELEKLSQKNHGTLIPSWLWTIYIHAICDLRQDFDALLQLLYKLSDSGFLFPRPTLLHLVNKASEAGSIHVTRFIWHGYVEAMHIIPDEEICLSVLRVAAEEQDLKLAESVAIVLESVAGNTVTDPPSLGHGETGSLNSAPGLPDQSGVESSKKQVSSQHPDDENLQISSSAEGTLTESYHAPDNEAATAPSTKTWTPFEPTSDFNPPTPSDDTLIIANSTPPSLRDPRSLPPPPRPFPAEALRLLADLGITGFDADAKSSTQSEVISLPGHDHTEQVAEQSRAGRRRKRRPVQGILYPLFREEAGLAGARFDPRLALLRGWDWRKK